MVVIVGTSNGFGEDLIPIPIERPGHFVVFNRLDVIRRCMGVAVKNLIQEGEGIGRHFSRVPTVGYGLSIGYEREQ